MISASELAGLADTAHLLRSPKNAQRLLMALDRALSDEVEPRSVRELRNEVGLE
jgi:antitoxin YefM